MFFLILSYHYLSLTGWRGLVRGHAHLPWYTKGKRRCRYHSSHWKRNQVHYSPLPHSQLCTCILHKNGIQDAMLECVNYVNTLRPRQNGRHFPDDIFKCIFLNEDVRISIQISLKFVPKGPINSIPALVQIMAWRQSAPIYRRIYASLDLNELIQWLGLLRRIPRVITKFLETRDSCWSLGFSGTMLSNSYSLTDAKYCRVWKCRLQNGGYLSGPQSMLKGAFLYLREYDVIIWWKRFWYYWPFVRRIY